MSAEDKPKYSVVIQWSEEDDRYIVSLPEWGPYCSTHGNTYEEAARNAQEVLELLLDQTNDPSPRPLPDPKLFHYPGADVVDQPDPLDRPTVHSDARELEESLS